MNNQTDTIAKILIGLAEYYEKQLTPLQMDMYVEDLKDLPPEELLKAIRLYRKDAKNDRFPLPAKLRAMLGATDEQNAREAASRIVSAISRIGPYRTEDACTYIGELGWEVVKRQGGWQATCVLSGEAEMSILQAQWRELAISLISRNRLGIMNEAPRLPNTLPNKTRTQIPGSVEPEELPPSEHNTEQMESVRHTIGLFRTMPSERKS